MKENRKNKITKFISIAVTLLIASTMLAGCDSDMSSTPSATSDTASSSGEVLTGDGTKSSEGYTKNLDGFVQYMKDNGIVSGDGVELTAAAIGAEKGLRFTISTPVSKHTVELYEYTDITSDEAKKTIANAQKDGSFHLFESTENVTKYTLAAVSPDSKFLMLYTDNSENNDKNDAKTKAEEAVKNFK